MPPRLASTVLLLRDHPREGLQVLLQGRSPSLSFAPDVLAFPGGVVETRDRAQPSHWIGPAPARWAEQLTVNTPEDAVGMLRAAVRETAEECGVRLQRSSAFDSSALSFWTTWVTPVWAPRRYRTAFFASALPPGQAARTASAEAVSSTWVSPRAWTTDPIDAAPRLLLPTRSTLHELAEFTTVAEALARCPETRSRQVWVDVIDGEVQLWVDTPEGPMTTDRYPPPPPPVG